MSKCINCPKPCKDATEGVMTEYKCELTGIWVYEKLPDNIRLTTIEDINPYGRRVIGLKYLLQSSTTNKYEAYTLTEETDLPNLIRFIKMNHCWIKN